MQRYNNLPRHSKNIILSTLSNGVTTRATLAPKKHYVTVKASTTTNNLPNFKDVIHFFGNSTNSPPIGQIKHIHSTNFTRSDTGGDNDVKTKFVKGEVLDYAVDLRTARPGDRIHIPYELTISGALQGFWNSAFHSQNRISTSQPFARKMGLQDRILPFSLVLFLTSSMTHADAAKVQVGFGNVIYHWPAFVGDTFTKTFEVQSIRNTSDGNHAVVNFICKLINQRGRVCMTADKRMLFEFSIPYSETSKDHQQIHQREQRGGGGGDNDEESQTFRNHILSKAEVLCDEIESQSLANLRPGQLIYHQMNRSLTFTQSQQLASIARLTHPRHFDIRRYDKSTEIMIPGGLILGLAMSTSSRDLHEILHEELIRCSYVNSLHPGEVMSGMTYVREVDENVPGDLESIVVRTIGIKNFDLVRDNTGGKAMPMELLDGDDVMYSRDVETICKEKCPFLSNKIVVLFDRRILRQSNRKQVFLL